MPGAAEVFGVSEQDGREDLIRSIRRATSRPVLLRQTYVEGDQFQLRPGVNENAASPRLRDPDLKAASVRMTSIRPAISGVSSYDQTGSVLFRAVLLSC